MSGQIDWMELFFSSTGRVARGPFLIAAAVLITIAFGPLAYVYTLEFRRMAMAILGQGVVMAAYALGVWQLFARGLKITTLAGGPVDQAIVAIPAIILGGLLLALAMNAVVAIDLAWRIARARREAGIR